MKILFAGTPEFAALHLQALIESTHDLVAVYTQPDRPSGRGKKLTPSPVKALAVAADIPVFQPPTLKDEAAQIELAAHGADIMVVVAYGLLLPKSVLDIPKFGCINVHASLLPRWRGAAPIQRAIEAGDTETGVTIMQMDVGLDTGDMLLKHTCPILPSDTASDLHDRLAALGPPALMECLSAIDAGKVKPEVQDNTTSNYAPKLVKTEALIDWQLPAQQLCARIRAFNPFPVCYTSFTEEERLRVLFASPAPQQGEPGRIISANKEGITVACGDNAITITELQLPGKKPMTAADALNGFAHLFEPGKTFI